MNTPENRRQSVELADIFGRYGQDYLSSHRLCKDQRRSFQAITNCRTQALGGHIERCDGCRYERHAYNSCRNRHCPKCQYKRQQEWAEKLSAHLPAGGYYHLVFTVPSVLHKLFYINQKVCYGLLFKSAAQALKQVGDNPEFLGARTGSVAVLHTWGQALTYHPHVHMIVPAGGLSQDQTEWVRAGKKFFLPVRALSKIYRAIFCKQLEQYIEQKQVNRPNDTDDFVSFKKKLYEKDWNVYLKRARGGANAVVQYLARYTHRVAISNSRLLSMENGKVEFYWKDYRKNGGRQVMALDATEFIQRFLMHVLPNGFYKVRYYGILSSVNGEKLAIVRYLTDPFGTGPAKISIEGKDIKKGNKAAPLSLCPKCKKGRMVVIKPTLIKQSPP